MSDDFPFRVETYADFGSAEPWAARAFLGPTQTLVPAIPAFAAGRDEFAEEMGEMFLTMAKAFQRLRQITAFTDDATALERESAYEDFYGSLWQAYKDRFPRALAALGIDIGFLFQADQQFEQGLALFSAKNPAYAALGELMRGYRRRFQTALAYYRNQYLEHRSDPVDPRMLASFYRSDSAQATFDDVWRAVETITASCIVAHLPARLALIEIPENQREKARPERFRLGLLSRSGR